MLQYNKNTTILTAGQNDT